MEIFNHYVLIGPNRHSERTVMELWLELTPGESAAMDQYRNGIQQRLIDLLGQHDIQLPQDHVLRRALPVSPEDSFAQLQAGTALALQQHAGHRIGFSTVFTLPADRRSCAVYEYEHSDAGGESGQLALQLLNELMPENGQEKPLFENYHGFAAHLADLVSAAPGQMLPRDTQAIINAAASLDVPCVKLEREPYEGLQGGFRVRPNGLLMLGQARYQQVVDGTFCLRSGDRVSGLLHDREPVRRSLEAQGVPLPARDPSCPIAITTRRAVRAADRIGYPVVVKACEYARASDNPGVFKALNDASTVRAVAEQTLRTSRGLVIEECVPGKTFKIVVANHEPIAVLELESGVAVADVTAGTHRATLELATRAARRLNPALLTLTVVSNDIGQPLVETGRVVNMNVAPELDSMLPEHGSLEARHLLDRAAEGLVRYLFPEGSTSRIPLVAVTGTNGKTTICGLIERVMQLEEYQTARAGTTGFFIGGEFVEFGDLSGGRGHHRVLESPDVGLGILETARGALLHTGLVFGACDVAVCTNVTPDHLGELGVETVEQMAEVKARVMQRARDAVVLNVDNEYSAGMLPQLGGRIAWLTSTEKSREWLGMRYGESVNLAMAGQIDGVEWMILFMEGREIPIMPVAEMPITFNGQVRYNVSNALQAAAACYQMGASVEAIRGAFTAFTPSFEDNPGRLNFYHGLPFTVLFDYAHNEDGYRLVTEFARLLKVEGRRVISYAVVARASDEQIMDLAAVVAGEYDLYICRNYPVIYDRQPEEVPALMKKGLMERGVKESQILELPKEDWVELALEACRPGDLLVFCASTRTLREEWEAVNHFGDATG